MIDAEAVVDLALLPAEVLHVLHPLEVGDHHAAGVRQDVRDHEDSLVVEHLVRERRGRAVGSLQQDLAAEPLGVVLVDHSAERGRYEHVALDRRAAHPGRSARRPGTRQPPAVGDETVRGRRARSRRRCGSRPSAFGDPDDLRAELVHDARRVVADVAEALHDAGRFGRAQAELGCGLAEAGSSGRGPPPPRVRTSRRARSASRSRSPACGREACRTRPSSTPSSARSC